MWSWLTRFIRSRVLSDAEYERERAAILARAPVPIIWLFGKTGSGKTSIIRYLTGATEAEIGDGFRPQTRSSRKYVFPAEREPLVEFLDTRGLGEVHYDPAEDIEAFQHGSHVVVVTVRARDQALEEVLVPLREIRHARPERPVLLALTRLHDFYPGHQHPDTDPFRTASIPDTVPESLQQALRQQQERFAGLVDRIVPLDLTRPEDGFREPEFGGKRLGDALVELLPAAYRQTILQLQGAMRSLRDLNERRAMPYIVSSSMLAATAGAVPVPWVDMPLVLAIQTHLVYRLGAIYGQKIDRHSVLSALGPLGGRIALRQVVRESLKAIPWVGTAANAALAYASTFALGKACCWYFGQLRLGNAPSAEQLKDIWKEQLQQAATAWRPAPPSSTKTGEPT
ncbi:MAG: YcjF family protein [Pirellulaceae bacterium]